MTREDEAIEKRLVLLKGLELFQNVPTAALRVLAEGSARKNYKANHVLFEQGDPGDAMYLVVSGSLLVEQAYEKENGWGEPRGRGEIIGEMALLDGEKRMATVRVREDSQLLTIHRDVFQKTLHDSPDFAAAVLICLARRLRAAWDRIHSLRQDDLNFRIQARLIELAEKQLQEKLPNPLCLQIKQAELAKMTGANPQNLSKEIKPLKDSGIIEIRRGKILIHDLDALRRWRWE